MVRRIAASVVALLAADATSTPDAGAQGLPGLVEQLRAELDYLTRTSWTQQNPSSAGWRWFDDSDEIRGAINDVRVPASASPAREGWVEPAIEATAAIGMMQGVRYLHDRGHATAPYAAVLDELFRTWLLARRQGQNRDP